MQSIVQMQDLLDLGAGEDRLCYFWAWFKQKKSEFKYKTSRRNWKKEALEKYGAEGSGKNLPFSSLSEDLKNKVTKKKRLIL